MFKKVFQSITEALNKKEDARPGTWESTKSRAAGKARNLIEKISATINPAAAKPSAAPSAPTVRTRTPEELCGIQPKMNKDEIKARLALLYRRYNRATSSLDAKLRAEAETMLDAIVAVREKTFGPI